MRKFTFWLSALFLVFGLNVATAQTKVISGTVSDESGALPGVSVVIKGTTKGTQTDFDGKYSLSANVGDVLVFSFVGMESANRTVGAANVINVSMAEGAMALEEVVVTAFGIKRNPKQLGYAVSKVGSDEIIDNSEPDLVRSLSGKVAGVNVNFSTGVAGASNQINIRGATTLGGASQPLIIVDGVAYDNKQITTSSQVSGGGGYESGLSTLDPNDIASINVLKSTAAAALYGSRASDGVIVITTKSGSKGAVDKKLNVNMSSGVYFEEIANLPEFQNTYGTGTTFVYANANGSWGPRFDTRGGLSGISAEGTIPTWSSYLVAFPELGPTQPYVAQPDNVKSLFKTGLTTEHSGNFSYSDENGNYGLTMSQLEQDGYIPFNTYNRNSISSGGSFKLKNGLRIGGSYSYSDTEQVGGFFGENQFAGASSSFARTLFLGRNWNMNLPYTNPITGASVIPNTGWDHPLWSWEHDRIITTTTRNVVNTNFGYDINKNITASYRLGLNRYDLARKEIRDLQSRALSGIGGVTLDNYLNEDLESTLIFNFNYELTKDLGLTAILGNNILQNTTDRQVATGTGFISPNIFTIENNLNVSFSKGLGYARKRTMGVFAEVGLSYRNYLFVTVTGRNDWSSTLPKNNNSYFYPSISTSFIFTEALKLNSDILTFGKLRAGYASVGRDASAEFLNRTFTVGDPYNNIPTISNNAGLADTQLTPEFTNEIEIGTDLEFFNRRAVVDFSWYKKITTDLISPVSVPSSSGFTSFNTNIGEMSNQGVEIGLTLVPVKTDHFNWTLFTSFTKSKNEVVELVEGLDKIRFNANQISYAIAGQPFGIFYGSKFLRDTEGNFLINKNTGAIFADVTEGIIGDPNPDFKMSFINTFKYKGFSLKAQFDWKEGGDISSSSIVSLLGRGVTKDTEDREKAWIIPGYYSSSLGVLTLDSQGNKIPNTTLITTNEMYFSPSSSNTFAINSVNEASIYDGTVYRLRELGLTYDLTKKMLENTPFSKVSLSVMGNNLWYFAPNVPKYTNFDPDVTAFGSTRLQGIEVSSAPTSKRYGFKVNLTF